VLPYAPEDPRGEDFTTETMNIMDAILSRIGLDDDGLGPNWSSTERIVHKFHMIDVWHRVKEVYQEVLENPPQVIHPVLRFIEILSGMISLFVNELDYALEFHSQTPASVHNANLKVHLNTSPLNGYIVCFHLRTHKLKPPYTA